MKTLGVGMAGYGFIGKVHTVSYVDMPFYYSPMPAKIKMVGVASYPISDAQKGVEQAGFEFATEDYRDLLKRDDIDIIDVCTPNISHKEIIIDALNAGKHVICEKPLAMDLAEAKEILEIAQKHPELISQITFNYRFAPFVMKIKQLIDDGFIGKPYSARIVYLHSGNSDPKRPTYWKIQKKFCGGGSSYDLASHVIDIVRFLLGDYKRIFAKLKIFVNERPLATDPSKKMAVDVDDLALMLFEMQSGLVGTLEATKVATGANDEIRFEVHGEKGALRFNTMQPNYVEAYDTNDPDGYIGGARGFKQIETVQRYPEPAIAFPGPKFAVGWIRYHMGSAHDFIKNIVEGKKGEASLDAGYKVQEIIEASLISDREKRWVDIPL
jgi:predicted dehydrogenase